MFLRMMSSSRKPMRSARLDVRRSAPAIRSPRYAAYLAVNGSRVNLPFTSLEYT
jgi:hypothetical protein